MSRSRFDFQHVSNNKKKEENKDKDREEEWGKRNAAF